MYTQEYGLYEEECYPYVGRQGHCHSPINNSSKCKQKVYAAEVKLLKQNPFFKYIYKLVQLHWWLLRWL